MCCCSWRSAMLSAPQEDKIDFSKPPAEGYVFLFLQMMFQIESVRYRA